jgi:hypothetical protein
MVKSKLDKLKSTLQQALTPLEFFTDEIANLQIQIKQNLEGETNQLQFTLHFLDLFVHLCSKSTILQPLDTAPKNALPKSSRKKSLFVKMVKMLGCYPLSHIYH